MGKVVFDRDGESGNIFWILGAAMKILDSECRHSDAVTMRAQVLNCDSYDEALKVIAEYVDLEER